MLTASQRRVATSLQEHMAQGIGIDAAVRLTAASLYEEEPFDLSGCEWVVNAFARVLGYRVKAAAPAATPAPTPPAATPAPTPPAADPPVPTTRRAGRLSCRHLVAIPVCVLPGALRRIGDEG